MSSHPSRLAAAQLRAVAADVCVAAQLTPDAMAEAAAQGFKSVVNNRPDHEHGPGQPTNAELEAAARTAGLQYRWLPVHGGYQSPDEITAFAQLLQELPRPLLAFCRSGARSARLFAAATAA
ncbi:MAG: TIGR01244 family phosphatase [Rubrivivax sp.]|nr:TIGR01244 family phosphatase [Rubrivivax sp.]